MNSVNNHKIKNFKDLKTWQKGIDLVRLIYSTTDSFPKSEIYGLSSQMKRASISVPSNIAEGFMRRHNKEFRQFLYVSLGSLAELETQILLAGTLGFLKNGQCQSIRSEILELNKMITGLIKAVNSRQ